MTLTLMFPDGRRITADTPTEALEILGEKQGDPMTLAEIKAELSYRAYAWANVDVDPDLPDDEFIAGLAECGAAAGRPFLRVTTG